MTPLTAIGILATQTRQAYPNVICLQVHPKHKYDLALYLENWASFWASLWKPEITLYTLDELSEWVGLLNITKAEKTF